MRKYRSHQEVEGDLMIQAEVKCTLHGYSHVSQLESNSKQCNVLMSGRLRLGKQNMKYVISWPQDFCTPLLST